MTPDNHKNNPSSSLLKDTRLSKGLTLEIVHEATKIPMDALRAIEEGYSTRILTPFYYRGFIKIYADFLGLNTADVQKEYNVQPPEVKPLVKSSKPSVSKPAPKAPNLFWEQLGDLLSSCWTPKVRKNLLRMAAILVALFLVVKMAGCIAGAFKSKANKPKTASVSKDIQKQNPSKKEQAKQDVRAQEKTAPVRDNGGSSSSENRNHRVSLTLHASKDTPIQVKADGKVVFQMTMKKGTVENWDAKDEIELSGRNLGDLDLEVNGRDVNQLGSFNRRVKRVVITKDGLTVKK